MSIQINAYSIKTNDYFYAMGKKAPEVVPSGAWYAYHAWRNTRDYQTEPFEVPRIPWGSKVKQEAMDFVAALREAGVEEFAVTDTSTSLLEGIHALVDAGAELAGTIMVKHQLEYDRAEERQGLRFRISGQ